jgi:hypothetical protein
VKLAIRRLIFSDDYARGANSVGPLINRRPGAEIQVASIHAALGENNEAISWLERAYQERAPQFMFLNTDPSFVGLRSDPKFRDLLRRVHLL